MHKQKKCAHARAQNNTVFGSSKSKKKHNTASTSRASFQQLNASGQRQREKAIVLAAIKLNQPITSRKLVLITGKERGNITRSLNDLVHESPAKIKVAFDAKCETTKRNVHYYTLNDWKPEPDIQPVSETIGNQLQMFQDAV
jgi:chromosome segregation and condensation protein ScpB